MTAENIYLYLFLVGVFFTAGNLAISGISHVIGGIGGGTGTDGAGDGAGAIDTDSGVHSIDMDSGGGLDGGGGFDGGGLDMGGHAAFDVDGGGLHGGGLDIGGHAAFDVDGGGLHGSGLDGGAGGHAAAGDTTGSDIIETNFSGSKDVSSVHGVGTVKVIGAVKSSSIAGHHTGGANMLSMLTTWLPIRPTALICFSTVTGGVGSILLRLGWLNPLMHLCSIASGYGISMLLGVALPRKLSRAQNTSAAERYELVGLSAQVTSSILENSFGRISYNVRGNTYSAPARHIDGKRVQQGSQVVICEIKKNVFYVTELNILNINNINENTFKEE